MYVSIRRAIKRTAVIIGHIILPTTYKILHNILLSRLTPYVGEIIGDHQCVFRRNRPTSGHTHCIRQIIIKKWESNEVVHQLFREFKKAYDSVKKEVFYNNHIDFGFPMKLATS
jgi:hypothetical protein